MEPRDPEAEQDLQSQELQERARSILLRQLTDAPKSRVQLERKLAAQGIPDAVAQGVLERFQEVQLIDDAQFARDWVRSRSENRSLASLALRRELQQKGVSEEDIQDALTDIDTAAERERGVTLVQRKLGPGAVLSDPAEREKQLRRLTAMLVRKGYQAGVAFGIVQEVIQERRDATEAAD